MAKRFHSNVLTNRGYADVIEIWDSAFGGTSTAFRCGVDGYIIEFHNATKNRYQPVLPSSMTFEMLVQNATHEAIIEDILTSTKGQFKVKLTRNGSLRWAGVLQIDTSTREDVSYPFFLKLEAIDLALLANEPYSVDDTTPHTGWETFIEHTTRILDITELPSFAWSGSDIMLSTVVDWYEDDMATGNDKDPLALTRVNHLTFYERNGDDKLNFMKALDVLAQLMRRFGCQIRQSGGRFRIFQVNKFLDDAPRQRHYDNTGNYLSNSAPTYTTEINQTETGARLAGGQYGWLLPYKSVAEVYKHRRWTNIVSGHVFGDGNSFDGPELTVASNPFPMFISMNTTRTIINGSNPNGTAYFERYKLKFKVGSYYLKRDLIQISNGTAQYEQATWTTSESWYNFSILFDGYFPALGSSGELTSGTNFTVPPFPASGESTITLEANGFAKASNGQGAGLSYGSAIKINAFIGASTDFSTTDTEYKVTADNPLTNSEALSFQTIMADGTTSTNIGLGRLQIWNGTDWVFSDNWKVGGTGTARLIQNTLVTEILAGQKTPIPTMQHTVGYTGYECHERLDDGDNIWAFLHGRYIARLDDWQGEWYKVTYSPLDLTVVPDIEIPHTPFVPGPTRNGGGIITISPNTYPTIPNSPGGGGTVPTNEDTSFLVGVLSGGIATTAAIPIGPVTSIGLNNSVQAGAYTAGQLITVVDAVNGITQTFTVASDSVAGDTSISVSGYAPTVIAPGAFIVSPQTNGVLASSGGGEQSDMPWALIAQRWIRDDDNGDLYPIQAPDIVLETSENAGNGSTAGLRFDGDGLQSFMSTSATAGVKVGLDGRLYLANLDTGTGTVGLVLEGGYVKQKTLPSAGVTDHGALTGLSDDDHAIYALLAGRTTGQTLIGGTSTGANLSLKSTSAGTTGYIIVLDDLYLATVATGTGNQILIIESGVVKQKTLSIVTDHGALSGLTDDDHTQYARLNGRSGGQALYGGTDAGNSLALQSTTNASRGVITMVDQVQLSNVPTGTGTAGLILEGGVIKQKTLPTVITDHGALTGLSDDDHTQYHNDARGDARYYRENEHLNASTGSGDAGKPVKLNADGMIDPSMTDYDHVVNLIAVTPFDTVSQAINDPFYKGSWLVPDQFNGYIVKRVDYHLCNNTSSSGSLKIGFRFFSASTNSSISTNNWQVTFNTSDFHKSVTPNAALTAGQWMHPTTDSATAGTLNGTVGGLLITLYISKI